MTSFKVKRSKVKVTRPLNPVTEIPPRRPASHHLQGAGAYCVGHITGRTACYSHGTKFVIIKF